MHDSFSFFCFFSILIQLIYKFLWRDFIQGLPNTADTAGRQAGCLHSRLPGPPTSLHATHTVELETESECPVRHSKQSAIWQMQTRKSHNEICQHAMSAETLQLVSPTVLPQFPVLFRPYQKRYTTTTEKEKKKRETEGKYSQVPKEVEKTSPFRFVCLQWHPPPPPSTTQPTTTHILPRSIC